MRKLIPIVTAGVLLVGGVGAYGADQALTSTVVLSVDGQQSSLRTYASSVGQALAAKHIEVGEHDTVAPSLSSRIADGSQISVRYGRPVTVTIDGTQTTIWTTATTVDEALALFGVDKSAVVSTSRSTTISREGLAFDVSSAHKVTVTADGSTATITASGTVAEALVGAGITLGVTDEVTPALSTPIAEGTAISVVRVTTRTVTKTIAVPYTTTTTKDPALAKGTTTVKTAGVNGEASETWNQTVRDGQVSSEVRVSSVLTKQAQAQVAVVGTKTATPTATTPAATGNTCGASWYASGSRTANGEAFNPDGITAAHKTLPFNTLVKVTNVANGQSIVVRINDRGPFIAGRCLDLARGAFSQIASLGSGTIIANWEIVG
ncbi:MAG: septal ring lytic transglycosylase RlpA family protein [Propionibacteriaceae bacterium]